MPSSGTLTKAKIIDAVAETNGFTRQKSTETVEILLELIKRSLESGDDVLISGFGKFCVKDKKKRRGRNPVTGKTLILGTRKVVTFHCSGKLRSKINEIIARDGQGTKDRIKMPTESLKSQLHDHLKQVNIVNERKFDDGISHCIPDRNHRACSKSHYQPGCGQ